MHFVGARGLVIMPKLAKLVGPVFTLTEEVSSFFTRSAPEPLRALASLHVWLYVCFRGKLELLSLMLQLC